MVINQSAQKAYIDSFVRQFETELMSTTFVYDSSAMAILRKPRIDVRMMFKTKVLK